MPRPEVIDYKILEPRLRASPADKNSKFSEQSSKLAIRNKMSDRQSASASGRETGSSQQRAVATCANEFANIQLVKLTNKTYHAWRMSFVGYLNLKGMGGLVQDPLIAEQYREAELRARQALLSSLDETALERIQGCSTVYDIFQRIVTLYGDAESRNVPALLRKFFSMKKESKDTMTEHFTKMDGIRLALDRANSPMSADIFMNQVILSLPAGYEVLIEVWDNTPAEKKTIEELLTRICRREADLKQKFEPSHALVMRSKMSIEERKKVTRCGKCGLKGHWARECETKPEDYVKKDEAASKQDTKRSLLMRGEPL